ncbi:MAG: DUF6082 family protein [Planctomycetota bacterium]|nr:DUF6082 family protein [Planctomycetota bacterium]
MLAPTLAQFMTVQDILPILQSLSSLAIAAGFLVSAYQFRTARRAQSVANFSKLVELQMQLRRMRVEDPTLARVYRHDMEGLTTPEEVREYFFNLMQLSVYEIVWYNHRQGQIPDDYYRSWERRVREIAAEPSFRRMITSPAMKIMHDEFQAYIIGLVRETPSAAAVGRARA